jgi:ubiquinol-cytochrome c reductase cytochrome b subunit
LRSVPNKNLGILLLIASIVVLFFLPKIDKTVLAAHPRLSVYYEFLFFFFIYTFVVLGYLGSMPATEPFVWASKLFTVFYFAFFILLFIFSKFANRVLEKAIGVERRKRNA